MISRSCFKIVDCVQGQGVDLVLKRSVYVVREHLKPNRGLPLKL
jgi:hypothetical protein